MELMEVKADKEVDSMLEHLKNVHYDKGVKPLKESGSETKLLEMEEIVIISIFTVIVIFALLILYVL